MNRKGLWAAGVVLLVVGVVGVMAIGTGYAKNESAAAKCSEATLKGTYLSPRMGLRSRAMSRGLSPLQAMMSLTAKVRSKATLQLTLTGRSLIVRSLSLGGIRSRPIAQAP
jgi:hypothetical protein